jgi:hypothetical protein
VAHNTLFKAGRVVCCGAAAHKTKFVSVKPGGTQINHYCNNSPITVTYGLAPTRAWISSSTALDKRLFAEAHVCVCVCVRVCV